MCVYLWLCAINSAKIIVCWRPEETVGTASLKAMCKQEGYLRRINAGKLSERKLVMR